MIFFIFIALFSITDTALAIDPHAFAQLLTERLNAFVCEDFKGNEELLIKIKQSHDRFRTQVPEVLKEYDNANLGNQIMVMRAAQEAQIKLERKLSHIYLHDFSTLIEKRSVTDTTLKKLHHFGLEELMKIRQFNIDPALSNIKLLQQDLMRNRTEIFNEIRNTNGLQDLLLEKLLYFCDVDGSRTLKESQWDLLKQMDKDLVLKLLDIDYEIQMAHKISSWLNGAATWIDKYSALDESNYTDHINRFKTTLSSQIETLSVETSMSLNERLKMILSNDENRKHEDFMMELIKHAEDNMGKDHGYTKATQMFKDLNKEIKRSKVRHFLTRRSTVFFTLFGLFLLIFYFSGVNEENGEVI